ncbi:MAG: MiaB/RimO family radical SAM methylthiotransferase [Coriobacteriaceae bacterium]|jgi:threonylcarbamoyladenosine tRNA methylthiotransferase MtaB|nr:MiaB/RimO family radical SAM methylthiotransferase [Coriobacteriaceae bacterium]
MRFAVVNLGCKVNRVESDTIAQTLSAAGAGQASLEEADVVVVNTCTVTGEAEKKARKALRHALRANPHAPVIATGCAVAVAPEAFAALDGRVAVEPDKAKVAALALALVPELPRAPEAPAESLLPLRMGAAFPTRVGIKVQDGCDNACTYCIVPAARGRAVSLPSAEVLAEARCYELAGVRELVLTGINLGSYRGLSQGPVDEGGGLAALLAALLDATDHVRFRISSIEPCDVGESLVGLLATSGGRICRHLHLPLQSGSSRVLAEMGRPYDAAFYQALAGRLYGRIPGLALSTDVIVGFPGESDADFKETASLLASCRFSKVHVFPYSRREGTPAAARADQVPAGEVAARAAQLGRQAKELRAQDRQRRRGTIEYALVEKEGQATTESYHRVAVDPSLRPGQLVRIVM